MLSLRLLGVLLFIAGSSPLGRGAETIRLRADRWMPFNGDPSAAQPGYGIEIARQVFATHNITLDYQPLAWGEALKAVATGDIDAVIGANRSEASGLVIPAEPIGEPRIAIYIRHDSNWRYDNLASLAKVRLGVMADYKYWDAFDAHIARQQPQVITFSGDSPLKEALAKLIAGGIDALAESVPVFGWQLKADGVPATKFKAAYIHQPDPVFIAFSPKHPRAADYARLLDEGIRQLRASGQLKTILARYGQFDWRRE